MLNIGDKIYGYNLFTKTVGKIFGKKTYSDKIKMEYNGQFGFIKCGDIYLPWAFYKKDMAALFAIQHHRDITINLENVILDIVKGIRKDLTTFRTDITYLDSLFSSDVSEDDVVQEGLLKKLYEGSIDLCVRLETADDFTRYIKLLSDKVSKEPDYIISKKDLTDIKEKLKVDNGSVDLKENVTVYNHDIYVGINGISIYADDVLNGSFLKAYKYEFEKKDSMTIIYDLRMTILSKV